jgi:Fe-Mn family superoxide dismutase
MSLKKTNEKIKILEEKILRSRNKKFTPKKLSYSFSSLKKFVSKEIMELHYNVHYKGYLDKLNSELSNLKSHPNSVEKIIRSVSRYNSNVKNNVGGVYNHQIFWNMLTPKSKRLSGDVLKLINKDFGSINNFKKEFKETALTLFGSGWVWLVINNKGKLKIITTQNQENPLMNTNDKIMYPLLGLDLWEHAFYLEYKADKKKYIDNFWGVINWDYVNTRLLFHKSGLQYGINESILNEAKSTRCSSQQIGIYRDLFNKNPNIKNIYKKKINEILRETFPTYWYEKGDFFPDSPFGIYDYEQKGRSVLNKINTNYTIFCTLVEDMNLYLKYKNIPLIDFRNKSNQDQIRELYRFLHYIDLMKFRIFNTESDTFKNIFDLMGKLDQKGDKREEKSVKELKKFFNTEKVYKIGGLGNKEDMIKGIDAKVEIDGKTKTIQIKPFNSIEEEEEKIKVIGTGNVKRYKVDYLVFHNDSKGILVFDNSNTEIIDGTYVFDSDSKLN